MYYLVCEWQGSFYIRVETEHSTTVYMDIVHSTHSNECVASAEVDTRAEAFENDPANWGMK